MDDPYFSADACYTRLLKQYREHGKLVVAVDFDGTLFDLHKKGFRFPDVIRLVRRCHELGFTIVIFSAACRERYDGIRKHLADKNIPFDAINENVIDRGEGDYSTSKIYYNILLDDRAGLSAAYHTLNSLVNFVEYERNNKPKYIYRKSDGIRFTLQENGRYTMDESEMVPKSEYGLEALTGPSFTTMPADMKTKKI